MENRFKLRISRMFRSSFSSCRDRNISDAIEKPVFSPQNHNSFHLVEPFSSSPPPKARSFPSISKPRGSINPPREYLPRRKSPARYPPFIVSDADFHSRKCPPPAATAMPLNIFSDCKDFDFYEKKKKKSIPRNKNKKKKKNNQRVHAKTKYMSSTAVSFSSSSHESANSSNNNNTYYGGWWIGSEDETETLFSSRTRSSDSSESLRQHAKNRKTCKTRRRRAKNRGSEMLVGVLPLEGTDKVKDNFAVVKSSIDPYNDFRTSMMEMIVERQLFTARDLEQLLQCFLSLNSNHHHHIIVEVFTEIWETLFA
ncbi:Transcription repressor OFP8 [Hibiscus syriacus]|uniref:Transcription repressor n=1 Tax=Hibiscus syriacus TaxID=106335 RepID=A0A6A3APD5_HIBSY|nr:transcription repressor OFP8-like [Hibiscus syriacus]KAE8706490.1 Transcription repressor OFP8 [Hibiscus syriacus]